MKNLKKALALTIASVSVFGTIASADFLNPMDSSPNMQQMAATAASGPAYFESYKTFCDGNCSDITYDAVTRATVLPMKDIHLSERLRWLQLSALMRQQRILRVIR